MSRVVPPFGFVLGGGAMIFGEGVLVAGSSGLEIRSEGRRQKAEGRGESEECDLCRDLSHFCLLPSALCLHIMASPMAEQPIAPSRARFRTLAAEASIPIEADDLLALAR